MQNVIIGAGPAGLYAAIKLHQAGLRHIVIYDPRAGIYTRPGHLNDDAYLHARNVVANVAYDNTKSYHIKDLERVLYAEAVRLGITIARKTFVRLHKDVLSPGVVVKNNEDEEETISAAYVFDATGAKRCVIDSLNQLDDQSPMKLVAMTEPPVKTHFIAYVNMSEADVRLLRNGYNDPDTINAEDFADSILALRKLGWKEMKFPRCHGRNFGKNKYCLYLHAPEELVIENYDNWVQTVLHCYAKSVNYQHVKPSKKYVNKPRFGTFQMQCNALQEVSYAGKNLPIVIALGDAQIDFDYVLGHGVLHGMQRIDALMGCIEILNKQIAYFDSSEYAAEIQWRIAEHKESVIDAANALSKSFEDAISLAQVKLKQAKMHARNNTKQQALDELLQELDVRQCYLNAKQQMAHLKTKVLTAELLNVIHHDLCKVFASLSTLPSTEQLQVKGALKQLASAWKEVGNALFKKKEFDKAIDVYKKALEIHELLGPYTQDVLTLYSNMAIAYKLNTRYKDAIVTGNMALELHQNLQVAQNLKEKIVFNLIAALCAQAQCLAKQQNQSNARLLHDKAKMLANTHKTHLENKILTQIENLLAELEPLLNVNFAPSCVEALSDSDQRLGSSIAGKSDKIISSTRKISLEIVTTESLSVTAPTTNDSEVINASPKNVSKVGMFSAKKQKTLYGQQRLLTQEVFDDEKSDDANNEVICGFCIIM